MPNSVEADILDFPRSVALVPIGGYEDPAAGADLRQKSIVRSSHIPRDIFLVNAVADSRLMQLGRDLWAVPVFVEVESVATLPLC